MIEISAVVLNWNGKRFLKECLDSIVSQMDGSLEVIFVDNDSSDDSVEFVEANYPQVRMIRNPFNAGFSMGVNIGIRASKGKYIALLNNDLEVAPGWFQEMKSALDRHPSAGFCACKMLLYRHRDTLDAAGNGFSICNTYSIGMNAKDDGSFNTEKRVFGACAGAAIYRREMLEDVGLFDEDFFMTHEDNDHGLRANLRGYECIYVPSAVVYHHHSGTIGEFTEKAVYYHVKNFFHPIVKNIPLKYLVKYAFQIWRIIFWKLCYHVLAGRGGPSIRAFFMFLWQCPKMAVKRIGIQARINVPDSEVEKILLDVYR